MSYYVRVEPDRGRMRFSSIEVFQILVAMAVLTFAFTLALVGGLGGIAFLLQVQGSFLLLLFIASSFVAVVTAFLLHELAHKAVAQRYGCFAEFRYSVQGLLLGLLTAAFGFMFAAPGAVVVSGRVSEKQNVRISAAGPGTNLAIGGAFTALAVMIGSASARFSDVTALLVGSIAFVNLFLGGFNMIPFPPLDGSKIFASNKILWSAMLAAIITTYAAGALLGAF